MDGVSARQVLRRLTGGEHIFAANRAIVLVFVAKALVRVKDRHRDAHATLVAVSKGFHSSHSTKAALLAMKRFFRHTHPEITFLTVVLSKDRLALDALVAESEISKGRVRGQYFTKSVFIQTPT